MFKDETGEIVPAIVSEALWDKANEVLRKRSEDVKGRQGICNHANLLTGKLFCTDCGAAYYRRESKDKQGNKNSKWVCSNKIKSGAGACASFPIYEEELKPLLLEVFRRRRTMPRPWWTSTWKCTNPGPGRRPGAADHSSGAENYDRRKEKAEAADL